ncbi:ABC transporter permease [Fusobacterium sp. PH5-44]|uniref:ABC transporter permease n=1 Tax=unclassified Fusobacterium TaxID=2648384 RepID=UPI003D1CC834
MIKYLWKNKYNVIALVSSVLVWEIFAIHVNNNIFCPRMRELLYSLKNIVMNDNFSSIVMNTLRTLILVLVISSVFAIIACILALKSQFFSYIFKYFFNLLRSIPSMIIIVLVVIWSNTRIVPLIVGTTMVIPLCYDNIFAGIGSIDEKLISMAKIYKVRKISILKNIYLPGVYFFVSKLVSGVVSLGFKVIIASEMLSQKNRTIGGEIYLNKMYLDTSKILAWVVIIILINEILSWIINIFNKKITKWQNY